MKQYTFKFEIDEAAWTMLDNKPTPLIVAGHLLKSYFKDTMVGTYVLRKESNGIDFFRQEKELFETKALLLESL